MARIDVSVSLRKLSLSVSRMLCFAIIGSERKIHGWLCDIITERDPMRTYSSIIRHHTGETKMTVNMGSTDRIVRAIVGIVLLALVFVGPQTAWGWLGVVPLATAAMGNCPAYSLLGIKTCRTK